MTTLWIALGIYLALGVATSWIGSRDMIAEKWWAWVAVVFVWPLFWFALLRGR